jgi:hypothetical protein
VYRFHCCDPRTSDVPTPTVTIAHPNLSGHLTFDEQYPVKKASRIISRKTNHPTSFIRVLKTDKGTVDSMLIDGVEMYGRFFTCETSRPPTPTPLQCPRWFQFGHGQAECTNKPIYPKCPEKHPPNKCSDKEPSCLHCKGTHPAWSRSCPILKQIHIHILKITKKANSMLFPLNKVFRKSSPAIFAKLYKTYVRPVLEFANCVWTPVLQRDIQLLESVQRRATRVPFGRSRPQYTPRLSLMGIPSLSARRVRGDLLVVFRALSSEQSPIRHLFTLHEGGRTRGHSLKLLKDRFVTTARQYFLTNRIFDQWNSLPPEIVNCKTADSFKAKYDSLLKSRPPDGP